MTPSGYGTIRRCAGSSAAKRLMVTRLRRARWAASRRAGSQWKRTCQRSLIFPAVDRYRPWSSSAKRRRARYGFEREPDAWRTREQRLERPLCLHLLSSAVRVQPVRRFGTLRSASRQRPQRGRLEGSARPGRGTLPRQGLAHLFSGRCRLCESRGLRVPRSQTDQIRHTSAEKSHLAGAGRMEYLPRRPVGRPANDVRRFHANFTYQAGSWTKPRRVIAKVEWHPGELVPRVGFIVTNLSRPAERVVAFYNKRRTCEQWMKEGKGAIKWTRLSCRTFAANAVQLQLHELAYNLGNFLRTLATPEPIKDWSLTSLKEKLIKIGAKGVSHGRYV